MENYQLQIRSHPKAEWHKVMDTSDYGVGRTFVQNHNAPHGWVKFRIIPLPAPVTPETVREVAIKAYALGINPWLVVPVVINHFSGIEAREAFLDAWEDAECRSLEESEQVRAIA